MIPAILACLLWSTAFVGIKIGLRYNQPISFAGIRFLASGLLIMPFMGSLSHSLAELRRYWRFILEIALLQTFLVYLFFFVGMTMVPGALGAVIIGASPLITALITHFSDPHDRLTIGKTISLIIGLTGVALITLSRQPWTSGDTASFWGIIILLISTTFGAVANVVVARSTHRISPLVLNAMQLFIGGLALLLVSIPLEGWPRWRLPLEYYLALGWLVMLSAVAFSIWFRLLRVPGIHVSELNLWKFIVPVFGGLLSWIILPDEHPDWITLIGMLSVAASIATFNLCLIRSECQLTEEEIFKL